MLCLPCEGIGSVPRSPELQSAIGQLWENSLIEAALKDTFDNMISAVGDYDNAVITDGEQTKPSFITYPLVNIVLDPNGIVIPFSDGHTRQLPTITRRPFKYGKYAVDFLKQAKTVAPSGRRLKQSVISASAMTLLYPTIEIPGYDKAQFVDDVVAESVKDIRLCLDEGADSVQVDFTEARLSLKLDPSASLLESLLEINERVFSAFTEKEKEKLGIHVCPGADRDSTHSADVEYSELLTRIFSRLSCKRFYLQMKSEKDPIKSLQTIQKIIRPNQLVFIGCIDVNDSRIETPEEVAAFIEQAAQFIPVQQLGCCDDCGFSPFSDDVSTSRDIAFAKIKARVDGARIASAKLL